MAILLFLLGATAFMMSFGLFAVSASAIHEILASIVALAGCVLIGCGGIVDAVNDVSSKLTERVKPKKTEAVEDQPWA